jgi:hypothetical protein
MNINATMKVSINSGAALILFLVAFFLLLGFTAMFPAVEKNFVAAGMSGDNPSRLRKIAAYLERT